MRRVNASLLALFFVSLPVNAGEASVPGGWEKISDDDGIVVYKKNLEGSDVISLRGETTIDASVKQIVDAMKDNATAHEWMPLVKTRRDIRQVDSVSRVEYTHIEMPWPITDRYFVAKSRADHLPQGVVKLSTRSVDNADQEFKDEEKVLGFLHTSEFVLTPVEGGLRTHMTLEVNSDPKGLLPKWIVNLAQKNWPRKFFTGLNEQLEKRGWLGKSVPIAH